MSAWEHIDCYPAPLPPIRGLDREACRRYILEHQTPEGGFCFYAYHAWGVEEPNAPDTLSALAALRLLGFPTPRRKAVADWLKAQQHGDGGYATLVIAYGVLKALRLLGEAPLRDPAPYLRRLAHIHGLGDPRGRELAGWLHDALRLAELWRMYGLHLTGEMREGMAAALRRMQQEDGGYGSPGASLPDTAAAVELAASLGLSPDGRALDYVRRCEAPPYGFNITPHASSSSLECHHGGLRVLCRFRRLPRHGDLIQAYILACQAPRGGFGRMPDAVPRLEDTQRGLEALSILARLRE